MNEEMSRTEPNRVAARVDAPRRSRSERVLVIGPAFREHGTTPARGDLLDLAIAAARLRQQDVSTIDANLESELVRVEEAPHDPAALREAP